MNLLQMMHRYVVLFFMSVGFLHSGAQDRAFYAGNSGDEAFYDVVQLSDGTFIISGTADDLDWLPNTNRVELSAGQIANNQGTQKVGFILQTDNTLENILNVVYISAGGVEDIRFIKTTNEPRTETGEIYISGNTQDADAGGYFIGKLNNNFVEGTPTGFAWTYNVKCKEGDYPKLYHPWDVDSKGRVYFVTGDSHDWNWSAMYRLDDQGKRDVVDNWRTHWKVGGGEFRGTPASSYPNGVEEIDYSGIVFKRDGRCNLRSWTQSDYDLISPDGNGGSKKGKWPLDVLFDAPCDPDGSTPTNGPGYTQYSPGGGATFGPSSVCVDRRNDDLYVGFNAKSILPDGNPDFEPALMKMDQTGQLMWWSRLYHEMRSDGSKHNSSPDQYIDGLAIDYSLPLPNSEVVVNARCHGNNVENLWEGNTIFSDAALSSYQNRFTGTSGNIHISWLGKLNTNNGDLKHSTYVAEMGQNTTGIGSPHPHPLMDGWADPNSGWINLNTTRLVPNSVKVSADGSVIILGVGRRPMTTRNAYFKMPNPYYNGLSAWSSFVRQYNSDYSLPLYSSIMRGSWDTLTTEPPLNVELYNAFKTVDGIVIVGKHLGIENDVPVSQIPSWGKATFDGASAFIAHLTASEIQNQDDSPLANTVSNSQVVSTQHAPIVFPNPTRGLLSIQSALPIQHVKVYNLYGQLVKEKASNILDVSDLPTAFYFVRIKEVGGRVCVVKVFKE
ncbi:MAG: T9SS type A sorting domain-containing protein [Bacteroidota bacterium]